MEIVGCGTCVAEGVTRLDLCTVDLLRLGRKSKRHKSTATKKNNIAKIFLTPDDYSICIIRWFVDTITVTVIWIGYRGRS